MPPQNTERLVHSLTDPNVLGEDAEEVKTLQTHMSWLLLAGSHVYKIKKPVDLGFADFSTLARRRRFCFEELRVNRRLAPDMYLDVVTICGTAEAPNLAGEGPPIEYAVKMDRFDDDSRLDQVLARGQLTGRHMSGLVRQIADFHRQIEVDADEGGYGTPEAVRKPMEGNFAALGDFEGEEHIAERLAQLKRWSQRQFESKQEIFAARKREGFVRECHGDMHLANMALKNGEVIIFDAIEFNEALRWIDVQSDLAFLVMDLQDRGRRDLSRRSLNDYLEITGDYPGLIVLPYYLTYRALVRAKVVAIRLGQKGIDDDERKRLQGELHGYLALAEGYTSPEPPRLVITHGFAASGKTTGSARLVESLPAVRLRSDVERKRLFGMEPLARTGSGIAEGLYSPKSTRRCYARLAELAETVVRAGWTVIVDAAFLKSQQRSLFKETADRLGVPWHILDFQADESVLRDRISQRESDGDDASEAGPAILDHQFRTHDPLNDAERQAAVSIRSRSPDWLDDATRRLTAGASPLRSA